MFIRKIKAFFGARTNYTIDPIQFDRLKDNEKYLLDQFLMDQFSKGKMVFHANRSPFKATLLTEEGKFEKVSLTLHHDIIYYQSPHKKGDEKKQPHFIIKKSELMAGNSKPPLGIGAFGRVYAGENVLVHQKSGGLIRKTEKEYAIKIQNHTERDKFSKELLNPPEGLDREQAALLAMPEYRAKYATLEFNDLDEIRTSYLVMARFKQSLSEIIGNDKNGTSTLTTEQRFRLSINILRTLKEQFHDREWIHRDIKPQNIMVDMSTLEVRLIDVGLSCKLGTADDMFCGTPHYVSPEAFLGEEDSPLDKFSDSYAMGIVIGMLWKGVNTRIEKFPPPCSGEEFRQLGLMVTDQRTPAVKDVGNGINDVELKSVQSVVKDLTEYHKRDRSNSYEAILALDKARLNHKLKTISAGQEANVRSANTVALEVYKALKYIEKDKLISKQSHQNATIQSIIKEALGKLNDSSEALTEFIETINIKALSIQHAKTPFQSGQEINAFVSKKMDDLFIKRAGLLAYLSDIEKGLNYCVIATSKEKTKEIKKELKDLFIEVKYALNKSNSQRRKNTLDDVIELTDRFEEQLTKLQPKLDKIKKGLQESAAKVSTQNEIWKRLEKEKENNNDELIQFKNAIKSAIGKYIKSTITPSTLEKSKRAASNNRTEKIKNILDALETTQFLHGSAAQKVSELTHKINNELSNMKLGFFGKTKLGSNLYNNVKKAIHDSQPRTQKKSKS